MDPGGWPHRGAIKPTNRQHADLLSAAADAYKFTSEAGRELQAKRIEESNGCNPMI